MLKSLIFKYKLDLFIPEIFRIIYRRVPNNRFKSYWSKARLSKKIDKDLIEITDTFVDSESYNEFTSTYWKHYGIKCIQQLIKNGIEKYSTTVARDYFTFLWSNEDTIKGTLDRVKNDVEEFKINLFKKHASLSYQESYFYNTLLVLLLQNLSKFPSYKLLNKLSDTAYLGYGDPYLTVDGINVTHDKINSLIDYDAISKLPIFSNKNAVILELGAGSARTSEAILTFNNNFKYVICDIPPSIYISYKRLTKAFPNKKIDLLFDLNDAESLEKGLLDSDICFIFPHQLSYIKEKFFNITIAINCLHEMNLKTLRYYFENINRISRYFYFSIWKEIELKYSKKYLLFGSGQRLNFEKGDYPVNKKWKMISKSETIFPSNFIQVSYDLQDNKEKLEKGQ